MIRLLKHTALFITLFLSYSCAVKDKKNEDNTTITSDTTIGTSINYSEIVADKDTVVMEVDLFGADSIFYQLITEKSKQKGAFAKMLIVTDGIVSVGTDQDSLLVVLLQTGTGSYGGIKNDALPFETIYSTLALLKFENNTYKLVDHMELSESGGQGLYYNEVFCSTIRIANDRDAVVMHEIDSEEGAGDSGHKYHTAKLFISSNHELTEILSYPVSHYQFSSDEVESFYEINIETIITLQKSEGLLKSILFSSPEMYPEVYYKDLDFKGGNQLFKWDGKKYILHEDYGNF
ncbi:hypothetical protein SanaruYs_03080 [Chryseotalea sanaruensis]|uniref:Uncharacterized protein n=1 Tax=Chryseotalea sanaruensis TaxID=2482724 RepID=A0A401U588_9BACT|nr:hypothetical protein [Chryseotalea sanaruensis]GCC50093.1 hypothetical protein SanaruYs_03080 [Chryseotalea sanaruensis]